MILKRLVHGNIMVDLRRREGLFVLIVDILAMQ